MTFENLTLEVLKEFSEVSSIGARERFEDLRWINAGEHEAARKAWLRANAWRRQTPAFRARAVETTRQWRAYQMGDPASAEAYRAKHAEQARRWRANRKARGGA